ncbi:hypothetical protein pqer_cds_1129 [Pandoravirus quercus]|uniref:Ankyrin repeat domain containing protein n=1 Tax=Pandoravirus quercus TaxID=2107709 RepID=A0A2U7UAS4_9VIRU|nr:hypothetical protein pqer_cds_1129 [Pandoravirus quercus]AVK75551.1 hypothetical protein pqer_cds_1129 [Pandoravirus quercus]
MAMLNDLPPELIQHITDSISRPRDLVAWSVATGIDVGPATRRVAAGHDSMTLTQLMERGAPLDVVRASVERSTGKPRLDMTIHAARGGRLDVVKYVWIEAADRKPVPRRFDLQSIDVKRHQRRIIEDALKAACRRAHVEVALWLLTRLPSPRGPNSADVVEAGLLEAVRAGHLHVIEAIHARRIAVVGMCDCSVQVAALALDTDQAPIVAWLHARSVDTRSKHLDGGHDAIGSSTLIKAISCGRVRVAQWLLEMEPSPCVRSVPFETMLQAAARDHLPTIALAHDRGLHPCTVEVLVSLIKGKPQSAVDALRWAAGEPTVDINVPVPDGAVRPIVAWGDPTIAYAALGAASDDAFRWLLGRPDAHRLFTVGAVRWALALHQGYTRALCVCAAGIVSFGDCDALATVVRHLDVAQVIETLDAGAPYTLSAMEAALLRKTPTLLETLCQRYGTGDVSAAVCKIAGTPLDRSVIEWLRDNVPAVCIADLRAVLLVGPQCATMPEEPCPCSACGRHP